MAKGKRKAFNDPANQLGAINKARQSGWNKGVLSKLPEPKPGGIFNIPAETFKQIEQFGGYQWREMKGQFIYMGTDPSQTNAFHQEFVEETKPDTAESWADKWVEENA